MMKSNDSAPSFPSFLGSYRVFLLENGKFREILKQEYLKKTPQDFCNNPYIFRFNIPDYGFAYFVGTDESFLKFQGEGKNVRWLHDLFEEWRQRLIRLGYSKNISIYRLSLHEIHTHETTSNNRKMESSEDEKENFLKELFQERAAIREFEGDQTRVGAELGALQEVFPSIDEKGFLRIPPNTPKKYRWWDGGQSVVETLKELGASEETIKRWDNHKLGGIPKPKMEEE